VITGTGNVGSLFQPVAGGVGGQGGTDTQSVGGGQGGTGGIGIAFTNTGASAMIGASVSGGNGGAGGLAGGAAPAGAAGAGGLGIRAAGVSLTLAAPVSGGLSGDGVSRAQSLLFTGGANTVTLAPGWALTGGIGVTGSLDFAQPTNQTLSNVISGSGSVSKSGEGTLTLTGNSAYSGGTVISGGTLQIGPGGSITGNVVNNAALAWNRADAASFTGVISGGGRLVQAGSGSLELRAANTYSGDTLVQAGRLLLVGAGTAGNGVGNMIVSTGATLDISGTTSIAGRAFNALNGGGIVQLGGQTMSLGAGTGLFTGEIAGTGGLNITGGSTTLQGINTYRGQTQVNSGATLIVNGSIADSQGLTASGFVGGIGVLPASVFGAGSTFSPGNSVGTISVNGNLVLSSGSTTIIEVQGASADRINVSGAATLGGTLRLVPLGGSYTFNAPYTLISASAVSGSFAAVNTQGSFGAGVISTISQTGTEVRLQLAPAQLAPSPIPGTMPAPIPGTMPANMRSVASALDRAGRLGGDLSPFFNLFNQPAANIGLGLNQLSGQVHSVAATLHSAPSFQFMEAMLEPGVRQQTMGTQPNYSAWISAFGGASRIGGDATLGSTTLTNNFGGAAAGTDIRLGPDWVVGFAAAGAGTSSGLIGGMGQGDTSQVRGGAYTAGGFGPLGFGVAVTYGAMDVTTRRQVGVLAPGSVNSDYIAQGSSTRIQGSWRFDDIFQGVSLTPGFVFQGSWMNTPAFTERANGPLAPAALNVSSSTQGISRMELGMRADAKPRDNLDVFARLAWASYTQRDAGMNASFNGLANSGFAITGPRPDTQSMLFSAGANWRVFPGIVVIGRLDSEFSGNTSAVSTTLRVRYRF